MQGLSLAKLLTFFYVLGLSLSGLHAEKPDWESPDMFTRIKRHDDGSRTVFRRSANSKELTKINYSAAGKVNIKSIYKMGRHGNPRHCRIVRGNGTTLFKVRYGYDQNTGRLVAEDMFDARVKRIDPKSGKEMPVRRIYYTYDAHGNQSKPMSFVFIKGKTAEEVFGHDKEHTTYPHENPFKTANPRSKPVGER